MGPPDELESDTANPSGPSFLRTGMVTFATSVASVAFGFVTNVVVARALGPAGKGVFDLLAATGALFSLVLGLSLAGGVTYGVARRLADPDRLLLPLIAFALVQAFVTAFVLFATAGTALGALLLPGPQDTTAIVAVAIVVAATSVSGYARGVMVGLQRIAAAYARDVLGRAAVLVAIVSGVAVSIAAGGRPDSVSIISAYAVGWLIAAVFMVAGLGRTSRARTSRTAAVAIARFALPTHASNVLQVLNYRLDLFVVGFFRGPSEVGLYALAGSVAQLVWLFSNSAAGVLFPTVAASREAPEHSARRSARVSRLLLWLSFVAAIGLAVAGPFLFRIVFGTIFEPATDPLLLLLPGVVVFASANVLGAHTTGLGLPRLNLYVALISLVVTIVLDLLLIPAFGMNGAAIASTCSYATAAVTMGILFSRRTGIGLADLIPRFSDLTSVVDLVRAARR